MTLQAIYGAEEGGLILASATEGSPSVSTSVVKSGEYSYLCERNATFPRIYLPAAYDTSGQPTTIGSGYITFGMAVYFDTAAADDHNFAYLFDSGGNVVTALQIQADGDLKMWTADSGAVFDSGTTVFSVDTWYYVEASIQLSGTGAWEIWVDGTSLGTGTSDFRPTGGTNNVQDIVIQGDDNGSGVLNIYFDDIYLVSDASTAPTPYGESEVFAYQNQVASQTADTGLTTNDDTTDTGNWDQMGETPTNDSNITSYSNSNKDGAVAYDTAETNPPPTGRGHSLGPNGGRYTVDGTINGAQWTWRASRGGGPSTGHEMWYGNDGDTPIQRNATNMALGVSIEMRSIVSEAANAVPLSTQHFAQGAEVSGNRDLDISEMWAFLLHTPASGPTLQSVAGNQPAATGVLGTIATFFFALTGNLPAPTGILKLLHYRTLTGSLPAMAGALAYVAQILQTVTGNLPAQSGVLAAIATFFRTLSGNLPAQSGVLAALTTFFRTLAGNMPQMSGVISTFSSFFRTLTGTLPAMSGVITTLEVYTRTLTGSLPSMSGVLAFFRYEILSGSLPAMSGTLSRFASRFRNTAGILPAMSGVLASSWRTTYAVTGSLPSMGGVIAAFVVNFETVVGSLPAQAGSLAFLVYETLAGSLPNPTGVLSTFTSFFRSITGSLPQITGVIALLRLLNLSGTLPAMSGALDSIALILVSAAGNLPSMSGVIATVYTQAETLAGSLPSMGGAITFTVSYFETLLGNLPAPTGIITLFHTRNLVGGLPSMSGAINTFFASFASMVGALPAQAGVVATLSTYYRTLAGALPTSTGVLSTFSSFFRTLTGSLPSMGGTLDTVLTALAAPLGNLPAPTGVLSNLLSFFRNTVGNLPAQAGALAANALGLGATPVGNLPASAGVLVAVKTFDAVSGVELWKRMERRRAGHA